MHCTGCQNLINMTLEEANFTAIEVDLDEGSALFESEGSLEKVEALVGEVFSELEPDGYSWSNLQIVKD